MSTHRGLRIAAGAATSAAALLLAGCGSTVAPADGSATVSTSPFAGMDMSSSEPAMAMPGSTSTATPDPSLPNACPAAGCIVKISSVVKDGSELKVSFTANYAPDVSRNHFHVYWDHFTSKEVSDDAETRFHVTQGDWVPTRDNPFITSFAASVKVRGNSKKICHSRRPPPRRHRPHPVRLLRRERTAPLTGFR